MREKLGGGVGRARRAWASLATCVAAMGPQAAPLRADHPGHGGHEGILGGIYHNLVELGPVLLFVMIVAMLVREARRRTG